MSLIQIVTGDSTGERGAEIAHIEVVLAVAHGDFYRD